MNLGLSGPTEEVYNNDYVQGFYHGGNVRLERQVQRWQEAGIIDAATAARIMAHERRASRPVLLLAIGGLGAFAIGVGLLSIIAANWGDIPRQVKLLAMLGLLGANAYGLLRAYGGPQRWLIEALALGYFALTLVSIALVGQTYNWQVSRIKHCCCGS